jgi:chromosome segregation ATPase
MALAEPTAASSRLDRLRQKHKALLSSSNQKIAQSRSRLDWYTDDFEGKGRKFFFQEKGKTASSMSDDDISTDSLHVASPRVAPSPKDDKLDEENKKLTEELKEIKAEREKLRKNLSQVAVQVQNASKAILSTKFHEANAKYSNLENEMKETQDRLDARESSTTELLTQMQKLRKENAKLASQVRMNNHTMTGTKNSQMKELQEKITDLQEINRELMLEKTRMTAQMGIQEEEGPDDEQEEVPVERTTVKRVRNSTMTMIQTQLAVSSAQLTSVEMELAGKENEVDDLQKLLDEARAENTKLWKVQGGMVDNSKVEELKEQVKVLETYNTDLMVEKMSTSSGALEEPLPSVPESDDLLMSPTQKRVRDSNLSMMKTKIALSSAQLTSVEQDLAETEHELMSTQVSLDEIRSELDATRKEKRELVEKLQDQADMIHELETRKPTVRAGPSAQIPTNIAIGVGAGEIGGTFDFGAAVAEGEDASIKVIQLGGDDDQTARSAMTGYTEASSMAQTYAVTIVQTKLADSHAKYAEMEMKCNELKGTLDNAMVEIGSKQTAVDMTQSDLADARDRNAKYINEMEELKTQIAVLEDKQIKGMKRQMRKAKRAEADESEEEEEEVIPMIEHRSAMAIINTKLQEANVKVSTMEREMDELADMLESAILDGEKKKAIIESMNAEVIETRKENADLYSQVQEYEAMNDIFEGARIQELETKLMGLETINQHLMLAQLEMDLDGEGELTLDVLEVLDDNGGGTKAETLLRKIQGLQQVNEALSKRNDDDSSSLSSSSSSSSSSSEPESGDD